MHETSTDYAEYLSLDREALFGKLASCVTTLCTCLFELGFHEAEETRGRARSYQSSQTTSANARYQEASVTTAEDTAAIAELTAQKQVLELEKDFLLRLIDARYPSNRS